MEHEKLESYQQLMSVAGEIAKSFARWPRGHGNLMDQLVRAITLAEGNGKRSSVEGVKETV